MLFRGRAYSELILVHFWMLHHGDTPLPLEAEVGEMMEGFQDGQKLQKYTAPELVQRDTAPELEQSPEEPAEPTNIPIHQKTPSKEVSQLANVTVEKRHPNRIEWTKEEVEKMTQLVHEGYGSSQSLHEYMFTANSTLRHERCSQVFF